jgi:hypothetical protein
MKLIFETTSQVGEAQYPSYALLELDQAAYDAILLRVKRFQAAVQEDPDLRTQSYTLLWGKLPIDVTYFEAFDGLDENGEELSEEASLPYRMNLGDADFPQVEGHQIWVAPDTFQIPPTYAPGWSVVQGEVYCDLSYLHVYEDRIMFEGSEKHADFSFETRSLYLSALETLAP